MHLISVDTAWRLATDKRDRFLGELAASVPKDTPVMFLCRSGVRSHAAAEAAMGRMVGKPHGVQRPDLQRPAWVTQRDELPPAATVPRQSLDAMSG